MLQHGVTPWSVAGLLGTSEEVIRRVYGHHAVHHLRDAADDVWSRRPKMIAVAAESREFPGRVKQTKLLSV
jgi:hypothetical protein